MSLAFIGYRLPVTVNCCLEKAHCLFVVCRESVCDTVESLCKRSEPPLYLCMLHTKTHSYKQTWKTTTSIVGVHVCVCVCVCVQCVFCIHRIFFDFSHRLGERPNSCLLIQYNLLRFGRYLILKLQTRGVVGRAGGVSGGSSV